MNQVLFEPNPPKTNKSTYQISIGFMMLLMVVFAIMSAGLFYASRVPMVRDEISVLLNGKAAGWRRRRWPHGA